MKGMKGLLVTAVLSLLVTTPVLANQFASIMNFSVMENSNLVTNSTNKPILLNDKQENASNFNLADQQLIFSATNSSYQLATLSKREMKATEVAFGPFGAVWRFNAGSNHWNSSRGGDEQRVVRS